MKFVLIKGYVVGVGVVVKDSKFIMIHSDLYCIHNEFFSDLWIPFSCIDIKMQTGGRDHFLTK